MSVAIDDLRRVPLFQGMTDRAVGALAALARAVEFADGSPIVKEGEEGDAFYLLVAGQATLIRHERVIRHLETGEFFGEIALVDGRPRTATIVAAGPVRALQIRREGFLQLLERFPAARLGIMMALTERIRSDARTEVD